MDVYIAKIQLDRLLEYVRKMTEERPRMYSKSKERWKDIADMSAQLIKLISVLIQEEVLDDQDETDFSSTAESSNAVITALQQEIDNLKAFVQYVPESDDSRIKLKLSRQDKQKVLATYGDAIGSLSANLGGNADRCIQLLQSWFNTRFNEYGKVSGYHYNLTMMSKWIEGIVTSYGFYLEQNKADELETIFATWLSDVANGNMYSVPAIIHDACSRTDMYTLTGTVLWDVLMDKGLSKAVVSDDPFHLYLSKYQMYDKCNKYNPDALDRYVNYTVDPSILDRCHLVGGV